MSGGEIYLDRAGGAASLTRPPDTDRPRSAHTEPVACGGLGRENGIRNLMS